mmetsp:Transcript_18046/g.52724  ORF Transcript_18046/g.52724 Transcript_18046/m.52724 type:complete len:274 (-) Transcript_18046:505-1326(-)
MSTPKHLTPTRVAAREVKTLPSPQPRSNTRDPGSKGRSSARRLIRSMGEGRKGQHQPSGNSSTLEALPRNSWSKASSSCWSRTLRCARLADGTKSTVGGIHQRAQGRASRLPGSNSAGRLVIVASGGRAPGEQSRARMRGVPSDVSRERNGRTAPSASPSRSSQTHVMASATTKPSRGFTMSTSQRPQSWRGRQVKRHCAANRRFSARVLDKRMAPMESSTPATTSPGYSSHRSSAAVPSPLPRKASTSPRLRPRKLPKACREARVYLRRFRR